MSVAPINNFDSVTLQELKIFEAFVKTGTTKATAELIKASLPTCTRAIASLEEKLELKLFLRARNEYCLTAEAIKLYEPLKQLLRSYSYSINHKEKHNIKLKLYMPIASSYVCAQYFIPKLKTMVDRLDIELMTFTVSNLTSMPEIGMLILNQMDMVLIRGEYSQYFDLSVWDNVANFQSAQNLYSSSHYLNKYGNLSHYSELQNHKCLISKNNLANNWLFTDENGQNVRIKLKNTLVIDSEALAAHAVDGGNGIALLSQNLVDGHKRRDIVRILPNLKTPPSESKLYVNKSCKHKNLELLLNIINETISQQF